MKIDFETAVSELKKGKVIAIPTETVYGLAASLFCEEAIATIYRLKNRPQANPLIVHGSCFDQVKNLIKEMPPKAAALANRFWPGPLTLILPATDLVPSLARAGLPSVAIRIPNLTITTKLLERVGPLVAPSANLSGRPSSTAPQHVERDFGEEFQVLDGGVCTAGVESTILLFQEGEWQIGRVGALAKELLEETLGEKINHAKNASCPGAHFKHYSPKADLTLGEGDYPGTPAVVVGYSDRTYSGATRLFSLGQSTDAEEVAHNLYHTLRQLDEEKIEAAWVDIRLPETGLFATLLERLKRAGQ